MNSSPHGSAERITQQLQVSASAQLTQACLGTELLQQVPHRTDGSELHWSCTIQAEETSEFAQVMAADVYAVLQHEQGQDVGTISAFLKQLPMFQDLTDDQCAVLAGQVSVKRYSKDEVSTSTIIRLAV